MLDSITPLILTFNEAPNIERTLSRLRWAKDIVIVDSYSSDKTLELAKKIPQVRTFQNKFVTHAGQWNFGLKETGISTEWVLALDADYVLSDEIIEELRTLNPVEDIDGFRAGFKYCIEGKPLRGSAYPPVIILYRREKAAYEQDGHTQRVQIGGKAAVLRSPVYHDDRKPLAHWLQSQIKYMKLESEKLSTTAFSRLGWTDMLRRLYVFAPFVMFFYCLFIKRAILDGKAGLFYTFQRTTAELILSLFLIYRSLIIFQT